MNCDFRLWKPPYIFLFLTIFAQNRRFLLSLITPVICTQAFILWSLKINIPLQKQSLPVGLSPVDVINLTLFFQMILYTVEVIDISDPIPLFLGDFFMQF